MHLLIRLFSVTCLLFLVAACQTAPPADCVGGGGRWLSSYKECENVSEEWCRSNKGKFKPCESVCRHAPVQGPCITQCVQVCEL